MMNDREQIIKHLEMIQVVINRLAHNSFLVKGWSMTILSAAILFLSQSRNLSECIILTFILPVIGFWILDGYFLWQERNFRGVYNDVRQQESTNFEMTPVSRPDKPDSKWLNACKWFNACFSTTLRIFYLTEVFFIIIFFIILRS